MEYRTLGRTGLIVSRAVFGGSHLGESIDDEATAAIVRRAWDAGVTTFYTADSYAAGGAERALGRAIASRRDDLVLVVKAGYRVGALSAEEVAAPATGNSHDHEAFWARGVAPTSRGLSRKHLTAALEASLRRLGTDYIDLYAMHFWDPGTPIEETLEVLTDFVRAGKVRYLGCSQSKAWQLYRALWAAEVGGLHSYQSIQLRYNVFERGAQADLLAAAAAAGVSTFAYSGLAGTLLADAAALDHKPTELLSRQKYADMYWTDPHVQISMQLREVAATLGRTMSQLAYGWVLGQPDVTCVLLGSDSPDQFDGEVAVLRHPLSEDEIGAVDAVLAGAPA